MIFIGYFEDISSQRGIVWRCEDSRSLARFLGREPGEETPDHSTLTRTRDRLPIEIHHLAFELVLAAAQEHGLLKGKKIGVDATDLVTVTDHWIGRELTILLNASGKSEIF